jgi:arylsulfatase A-like enzyme
MTVDVNGRAIGQVTLAGAPGEYSWRVPEAALVAGDNLLGFSYANHESPSRVLPDSQDLRSLAVAFEWLALEGASAGGDPGTELGAQPLLLLPGRSQLDYFLRLHPGSSLSLESVSALDERDPGGLEVEVATDSWDEPWVGVLEPSPHPQRLELPTSDDATVARVSLRAVPAPGDAEPPGGFALRGPRIEWLESPKLGTGTESPVSPSPRRLGERPSVIIYMVDTLRADHLGAYGYPRSTTPHIDAFAGEATLYLDARANSSWTRPAVASILTGISPDTHGVNGVEDALPRAVPTLGELLGKAGYATSAFVTNGNVGRDFGFDRGFDDFVSLPEDLASPEVHQSSARLHEVALAWLREQPPGEPFLLYLHATDPHGPYAPPEPFRTRFAPTVEELEIGGLDSLKRLGSMSAPVDAGTAEDLRALYDAEIAFLDAEFGLLLDELRDLGRLDGTLFVFLSDHGEEFHDHGWWEHGKTLYAEQLDIPLIVRFPGGQGAGVRVEGIAEQIDVVPTVLEAAGVPVPDWVEGSALSATPRRQEGHSTRGLLARDGRHVESLELGGVKLIEYRDYAHPRGYWPGTQLFDLERDPGESENLADERPVLVGYLRTLLRDQDKRGYRARQVELDDGMKERLRALGYLD